MEQLPDAAEDQRAATVHPPTVEMLVDLGLEKEAFSEEPSGGMSAPLFHFRDRATGELFAVFDISLLKGEVPLPVRAAMGAVQAGARGAAAHPGERHRRGALLDQADRARAARRPCRRDRQPTRPARAETLRARYLIGTDGASSAVRRLAEIEFEGFTWPERFIKIGTTFDLLAANQSFCTRNYFFDPDEWLNLFKVKGYGPPGIWRGVFPVPPDESDEAAMSPEGVQRRLQSIHPKSGDYDIPYHALYAVHQRVAKTFNNGRVLLAGDSAHVNNPIGGMGMNGGIHDADQSRREARRRLVRPRRRERVRPLHPAAAQGADRLRPGADHPEQEDAGGEGPGDAAPAPRRTAAHRPRT